MPIEKQRLIKFGSLELLAKQVVEGFITGLHKSPFHGFSVEFAEHRLYNKGESVRHVDWKLYARTEKLFVKRYEEETNLRCRVIIDNSSSMYYKGGEQSKMQFSVHAAASLIELLRKQRDAIGLSVFSEKVDVHTPAKSSLTHMARVYDELNHILDTHDTKNKTTSVVEALHEIADKISRRSLVLLFSDMMDSSSEEDLFQALQHLKHNKHEVVLFHVLDNKREVDFEFSNRPYTFIDMETGEKVKLNPNQIKHHFKENMNKFTNNLKLRCGQFKIDFVPCDINEGYEQILMKYLIKRNKMI